MTIAALEATLRLYRDQDRALKKIPTLRMLTMRLEESKEIADELLADLKPYLGDHDTVTVVEDVAYAGGGSLPMADIPSMVVRLKLRGYSASDIEQSLRTRVGVPVITRINDDHVIFDPRTFVRDDHDIVVTAISELTAQR
jgi:L-seryl-tRNA(Ser) seleniumtransferase